MPRCRLVAPLVLLLLLPALSFCSTIYVGFISFDVLIPAGPGPGVNVFNISNFTGDPGTGGFALPPDFPVFTNLTFLNASLTVNNGVSLYVVQGLLGHANTRYTQRYAHLTPDTLRGAAETVGQVLASAAQTFVSAGAATEYSALPRAAT